MDDTAFDTALIAAAFTAAAANGWPAVSVAGSAADAELDITRARARFAGRDAILMRFGRLADAQALAGIITDGTPRDRLFDILMRRFDALQTHRPGILALLQALPANPALALLLAAATNTSMAAMLEGAGVPSTGLHGILRTKGLTAAWFYTLRAWEKDDSADLSGTMAALDRALAQAERFGQYLERSPAAPPAPKPFPDDPASEPAPTAA